MPQAPFYQSAKWRKTRASHLALHPYCVVCERVKIQRKATEVDHIRAMRDGGAPFDHKNLQSLCKPHHSQKTAKWDNSGWGNKGKPLVTTGEDGYPIHIELPRSFNRGPKKY